MAAVKTKLGRIPCDCCGHLLVLKENEAKTLTIQCDECDVSAFAKPGTLAARKWRAALPVAAVPVVPVAQAPKSVPKAALPAPVEEAPAPVPKKAAPFDPLAFLAGKK
jgi:hypothetical protein